MNEHPDDHLHTLRQLLTAQRIATLAVSDSHGPVVALVAVAVEPDFSGILLHLSSLSAHKRLLASHPHCSLLIHEQDDGRPQPLLLRRASISGRAEFLPKSSAAFESATETYLSILPASRMLFSLVDFDMIRIRPSEIRYIAGFGQAWIVPPEKLSLRH